jgi:uncharacterized protein YhjY with autotransporter beta-barrel domain
MWRKPIVKAKRWTTSRDFIGSDFQGDEKMNLGARSRFLLSLLGTAGLGLLTAKAQTVTLTPSGNDLYNTGYDGTVLAGNNQPDTHYALIGFGNGTAFQANPLAGGWAANPGNAQWITISNTTTTGPTISYDYRLTLTNIPAGRLVTISGLVAADDNVTISGNGSSPFFSNFSPKVVTGNFGAFTAIPTTTFVSGTSNFLDFVVNNVGGGPTGLNLVLTGSYVVLTSTVGLDIQIDPAGLDRNQTAVLNYINRINAVGVNNACFTNLTAALLGLDSAGSLGAAMDQLSPEKLNVFSSIAFNNASFMTQDLDDYLAHRRNQAGYFQASPGSIDTSGLTVSDPSIDPALSQVHSHLLAWTPSVTPGLLSDTANPLLVTDSAAAAATPTIDHWNVFLQGDVVLGENLSDQDLDYRDSTTSSFEVGADYEFGKNFLAGAFFQYSHTDTALDNNGSTATIDSYAPGVYASYAQDGWYGNALASYSHNAYTEQRNIDIGTYSQTANAAPEGDQETVDVDGGYDFHDKNWTFGPTIGFQYTHLSVDSFTETGACSTDLAVDREAADSFRSRLGGHVSYSVKSGGVVFQPFLDASWQHEFLDNARGITSSFSEIGMGQFTVYTPDPARESALLATGLNIDIDGMMTVFANYEVQVDPDNYFGQSILAGIKLAF